MKPPEIPVSELPTSTIPALLSHVAKSLVQKPEHVRVKTIADAKSLTVQLLVAESDLDWVLGRDGRMARSLETIVRALGKKIEQHTSLDIQAAQLDSSGSSVSRWIAFRRKKAEKALLQSEKLAAVGRLASSVAHEINNPLEAITNLLYIARGSENVEQIHEMLDAADAELRRVSNIASQTLRFHKQSTKPQNITSSDLFSAVLMMYEGRLRNSSIAVESRMSAEQVVTVYEGDIRQVLNNLIGNAIDAMPHGGRLSIRSRIGRNWKTDESGIVLTVADNGTGISPADLIKIFEAFFTTKGIGGTGLGLWVSREIVDRHRGHLRMKSSQRSAHRGTVATVFLPLGLAWACLLR